MIDEKLLKNEERAVFAMRSLYSRYGYLSYKMSKFEEYELYLRNKEFLVSDRVITFNDTNGKLLALKPDVTLSIIKNGEDERGIKQKVYYNENVYRISESTRRYKEILQSGLECIGDIDLYDIYEILTLAAQSLSLISDGFVLEVSHLGILSDVMLRICPDAEFQRQALRCIEEKNAHDLRRLCRARGVDEASSEILTTFVTSYGERNRVISALEAICGSNELQELKQLSAMLDSSPYSSRILFDFSVVNNMSYYNGFVFKGFLDGICDGVLAGGQYDRMMERMGRRSGAIGFALYLDLLEQLQEERSGCDVNVLLLYDDTVRSADVAQRVKELIDAGLTVSAQKAVPEKLRFREMIDMRKERKQC